uniref:Uncharacterized protein n=1 Tax=Zea mays TaxID=4577 RepID=A0A804U760_MAIZE
MPEAAPCPGRLAPRPWPAPLRPGHLVAGQGRCRPRPETAAVVHSLHGRCPEAAAARRRVTRGRSRPRARHTLSARPPEAVVESSHVSARTRPFARGQTRPHVSACTQLHTGRQPSLLWAIQVPPGNLLTLRNEDSEDAVASFVDGLLNSGGASGSNQPPPFDQPPPFE